MISAPSDLLDQDVVLSNATPETPRELFLSFARLARLGDVNSLVDSIDWSGYTPAKVYWTVLQRLPESADRARIKADYSPREHIRSSLMSHEFQKSIMRLAANAFPDVRRIIHIHIPRTAGTDIVNHLSGNYPTIHRTHGETDYIPKKTLFTALKDFGLRCATSNSMFLTGHVTLPWYLSQSMYRFDDRVFTVIRNPEDMVISLVNYIMDRFESDPKHLDTKNWCSAIGYVSSPDLKNERNVVDVASRLLGHKDIISRNTLCRYLGGESAERALDMIVRTNIEICELNRYASWLDRTWNIKSISRKNASKPRFTKDMLNSRQREYVRESCQEDIRLYDLIMKKINGTDETRIFGGEL